MGSMKRSFLVAGAALTAAATLTACGGGDAGGGGGDAVAKDQPFRVVVVAAQSGPLAVNGTSYVRGIKVAADEINSSGGVLGQQVEVEVLNSQGDATKAVSLLRDRLDSGPKPAMVLDGTISNETIALLPILTQNKVLSCGVSLTSKANQPKVYPYSFHVANHATDQAAAMAVKLKDAGYKKVGLFQQNDANGQVSQEGYKKALTDAGFEVIAEAYDPTALDMTAPLQRLASQQPDVIVVTANGPAASYVFQSRLKAGITIPTFADTSVIQDIASLVPAAALDNVSLFTFGINKFIPEAERDAAEKSWYDKMEAGGDIKQIMFVYAASHDCVALAAAGAKKADSFDAADIAKALESGDVGEKNYVAFKKISYSADDHFVSADADEYAVITPIPKTDQGTWKTDVA
jgi:branched-chain amino acid transport system substrate-binding protein